MTDQSTTEPEEAAQEASQADTSSVDQEVEFINKEVLQPVVTPITGLAKPMADQAAAMMIQDMQSFLQGTEQVLTIAIAKAAALMLDEKTIPAGTAALAAYTGVLTELTTFSTAVGLSATTIASGFKE